MSFYNPIIVRERKAAAGGPSAVPYRNAPIG